MRITAAADHIESRHPKDAAIGQALRDLHWAEHNIRNQTSAIEQQLRDQQQKLTWAWQEIERLQEVERVQAELLQSQGGWWTISGSRR